MWTRQAKYDDAVSKGESAFMLSSASGAGPDVFKVSLGNLQPAQDVAISFTYVSELARSDGPRGVSWRTVLPTVLVPAFSVAPQPFSAAALPEVRSAVPSVSAGTSAGDTGYSMTVRWSASTFPSKCRAATPDMRPRRHAPMRTWPCPNWASMLASKRSKPG